MPADAVEVLQADQARDRHELGIDSGLPQAPHGLVAPLVREVPHAEVDSFASRRSGELGEQELGATAAEVVDQRVNAQATVRGHRSHADCKRDGHASRLASPLGGTGAAAATTVAYRLVSMHNRRGHDH
jgi:hypothetical protein